MFLTEYNCWQDHMLISENDATYTKEDPELVYSVTWHHSVNVTKDLTFTKLVPLKLFMVWMHHKSRGHG